MKISARRFFLFFLSFFLLFIFSSISCQAQTSTKTNSLSTFQGNVGVGSSTPVVNYGPGDPNWQFDAEVTQVGKNSERARQFIYWVIKHPIILKVPIIGKVWATVRNVAYALSLLVIIGLALHLVISVRNIGPTFSGISLGLERLTIFRILIRIVAILLFITFSYILIRLLIEGAEVLSRFFIEYLGGQDLFNIVFSGGNVEQNYTNFIGFRNFDPLQQEMANTSLFLVRFTSFTYNFMGVILILRQIILLFLLIVSPLLAIILPFIFIRNTGFVWIGEFFRWLFYGPLFALFISALAQIWKAGIPYAFDFTRARAGEVVYPTAVNILYGGPAQVLTATNTGNYIDTYAEYVIGLIMLWAAIVIPWLLLKIFRDYCCDILRENQSALLQILDKVRNLGLPPVPPPVKTGPAGITSATFGLPFRQQVIETKTFDKERIIERIRERNIENIRTQDLLKAVDLEVKSITDVARTETNKDFYNSIQSALNKIQNPSSIPSFAEQKDFDTLKEALISRASQGDMAARKTLQALTPNVSQVSHIISDVPSEILKQAMEKPGMPVIQTSRVASITSLPVFSPSMIVFIADKTQLPQDKVEQILKHLPLITGTKEEKTKKIAQEINLPEEKVQSVIANLPDQVIKTPQTTAPAITIEEYEEVKSMWRNHYRKSEIPLTENIQSREDWLKEDIKKLTNTINLLTSPAVKDRQKGMEEVANLLPFLLLGGFGDLETLTYIKAKLEAAKLVMEEMEQVEKAKEQGRKEEEKIEVPVEAKKEEEKEMEFADKMAEELPLDEKKPEESLFNQDQPPQTNQPNVSNLPDENKV